MKSTLENQSDKIRLLVESARLEDAIDSLAEVDGFQNHASAFRSRLSQVETQDRKGVIERETADAIRNKIADDILVLISEDVAFSNDEGTPQPRYAYLRPALREPPFILPQLDIESFTGRVEELKKLEEAIFDGGQTAARIAGLTGTGGMGKSILAFHFATINRDRFPDGVIGLRVDDEDLEIVAQRFASNAGATIPFGQKLSASEIMQSIFQNKRALLIFDNADDATVKMLRPGGSRCAVIVTTRNKGLLKTLEIPTGAHIDLDSFSLHETHELLGKIIEKQRVEAETDAVRTIHEMVGGLPLAIRIVGGTLYDQPFTKLAEFVELLGDERACLRLLRDPDDDELDVEASFELSLKWLESLNEMPAVKAFACLAACPQEGFSLLAAQVVSEQDEFAIKGILGRLARLSLVGLGDRPDEFVLHPLLFLFARRKAEDFGWRSAAEQRHTDFFVNYVRDHREPSRENFDALEAEVRSLLLAGRRLAANQRPNYEFYIGLEPFLEANGYWSQALELLDLFLVTARTNNDPAAMAQLALQRGQFLQLRGNFEEAKDSLQESQKLAAEIENVSRRQRIEAMVLNSLGGVYQRQGNFDDAVSAFEQSKQITEKLGNDRGLAMVLNSLGGVYQRQGNFEDAVSAFEQSKHISEELGDERSLAMVLNSLGGVYQRQARFDEAVSAFKRSKQISERFGDEPSLAMVLNSLGSVYQRQGNFNDAVSAFEQSKQIGGAMGDNRHVAMVLTSLGGVYQRQGNFEDAVSAFEQSKQIMDQLGNKRGLAIVLNSLGGIYQRQGNFDDAVSAFEQSKQIAEKLGDERGVAMVLNSLGGVYQRQGRFDDAVSAFQQSRQISEKLGDERSLAMVLNSLGGVYQRLERYVEAVSALKQSADLETKFGNLRGLAMVLTSLSGAYRKQASRESWVEAIAVLEQAKEIEEKLGNQRGQAMVLNSLGDVYQRIKDFERAIEALHKSYDLEVLLGDRRGEAMVLTSLGIVYQQKGDLNSAVRAFRQSHDIEQALGDRRGQAMALCAWGKALLKYKDHLQAAEKLKLSFEIDESLKNVKGLCVLMPSLISALTLSQRKEEAGQFIDRALAIAPSERRFLTLQRQLAENHPVSLRSLVKTGTIKRLLHKPSGYLYGFIAPEDESDDIYFGEESISKDLLSNLIEGTKVKAEIELSARGPRARLIRPDGVLPTIEASDTQTLMHMDHEPEQTERLFSYGTLQTESVQLSTFGRKLNGSPDSLAGYRLQMIRIADQDFVVTSGAEYHRNLEFTGNPSDFVEGTALSVTEQELKQSDAYEPDGYERRRVKLRSGAEAWVYVCVGEAS